MANSCPAAEPYRCSSGQCALSNDQCLSNDYGCPGSLPYRCKYTGVCMVDSYQCFTAEEMFSHLSILPPTYNPGLCKRLQKIACFSKNGLFYCANSADECFSPVNGCPVRKPILCSNGLCVNSIEYCETTSLQNSVALAITNH